MDKTVEVALESTFGGPTKAKSIAHSNDTGAATETFELLKSNGHSLDPDEICKHLNQAFGWNAEAQKGLKKLLLKINKKNSASNITPVWWMPDIYMQWKNQAEGVSNDSQPIYSADAVPAAPAPKT